MNINKVNLTEKQVEEIYGLPIPTFSKDEWATAKHYSQYSVYSYFKRNANGVNWDFDRSDTKKHHGYVPPDDTVLNTWRYFLRDRNNRNATINTMYTWLNYNFPNLCERVQYYWDLWDGSLEPGGKQCVRS